MAKLNSVYIIEYNNLEPYEDNNSWIGEVFKEKTSAENYLKSKGFSKGSTCGRQTFLRILNEFESIMATIKYKQIKDE